jgi:hypothetical protein
VQLGLAQSTLDCQNYLNTDAVIQAGNGIEKHPQNNAAIGSWAEGSRCFIDSNLLFAVGFGSLAKLSSLAGSFGCTAVSFETTEGADPG